MSLRNSLVLLFSILTVMGLLAVPGYSAAITTYNTANSWQVAVSTFQTIDFSGLAPANSMTTYASGLLVSGVQFIGLATNSLPMEVLDTASNSYFNYGTGDAITIRTDRATDGTAVPYLHIILPVPVTAVAFNLFTASPSGLTYTVTVPAGQYNAPTTPLPTPAFFGITSDTAFSTVDLTLQGTVATGGTYAFMDNFAFGTSMFATPESSTYFLFGAGLTAIGLFRRRGTRRDPTK